jgi:hypothetical protein
MMLGIEPNMINYLVLLPLSMLIGIERDMIYLYFCH